MNFLKLFRPHLWILFYVSTVVIFEISCTEIMIDLEFLGIFRCFDFSLIFVPFILMFIFFSLTWESMNYLLNFIWEKFGKITLFRKFRSFLFIPRSLGSFRDFIFHFLFFSIFFIFYFICFTTVYFYFEFVLRGGEAKKEKKK